MTYCVGWIYQGCVYLMADSFRTSSATPSSEISSFREVHQEVGGYFVEESLLKIAPISSDAAVAFAGDVSLATTLILFLREHYGLFDSAEQLLAALTNSHQFDPKNPVVLLLAIAKTGELPRLIHWNSVTTSIAPAADIYQIGSLVSYHSLLTTDLLNILNSGAVEEERMLPVMCAIVQSYGVHDNLSEYYVGGIFFGMRVHHGSTEWQSDTNYVLHNKDLLEITYISAFVRDNALVVNSSATNETRVLMHPASASGVSRWLSKWPSAIQIQLSSDNFRYWVFIRIEDRTIVVVRRNDLTRPGRLVHLLDKGGGTFIVRLSPELKQLLERPSDSEFSFTFRND